MVEAQLAHAVRDSLGRAYNRTEFVEQRRSMMQTWADYLDTLGQGGGRDPLQDGLTAGPHTRRKRLNRAAFCVWAMIFCRGVGTSSQNGSEPPWIKGLGG